MLQTCNVDPLTPHFYIVKLVLKGVNIVFLILLQKHRLWVFIEAVLICTHSLCFEQKIRKKFFFSSLKIAAYHIIHILKACLCNDDLLIENPIENKSKW